MPAALTKEVMWQAKQLYAEKDKWGRALYSYRTVAKMLGISESSVMRAVTDSGRFGNYQNAPLPVPQSEQEMKRGAKESEQRLLALLAAGPKPPTAGEAYLARAANATKESLLRSPPESPLDGGLPPQETDGAARERLAAEVAQKSPDELVKELIEGGKDEPVAGS